MRFKSFFTLLIALTCVFSLAAGHRITFTVTNIPEEFAVIGFHLGDKQHAHDTVYFNENFTAVLEGDEDLPKGIYFLYTPSLYLEFLVAEQEFSLATTLDGGYENMKVEGSRENELFQQFQEKMILIQREQRILTDSLGRLSGEDSVQVRNQLVSLSKESNSFRDSLIKTNEESFFSKIIGITRPFDVPTFDEIESPEERQRAQFFYYKDHYFDHIDEPEELLRTPVFREFVLKYFDELVIPRADSVIQEIDWWVEEAGDTEESFRFWIVTFFKKYQDSNIMGMDKVWVHLAEKYYLSGRADWLSDQSIETIQKEVRFLKPNLIGNYAPAFSVLDTAMNDVQISSIPAKYLVLYFYDPDCGHCRKKTPVLREAYDQIKMYGGEVIAVCTTGDIKKWKKYVRENNLDWINVADPYGKSNFRVDYNVRTTPQLFVLDQERKIVAKKLDIADQLLTFLEEHQRLNP